MLGTSGFAKIPCVFGKSQKGGNAISNPKNTHLQIFARKAQLGIPKIRRGGGGQRLFGLFSKRKTKILATPDVPYIDDK